MRCIIADEHIDYDGSQIGALWAYARFRVQEDSIVCFRGRCNIPVAQMVDLEDRINSEKIESPDMIHFIVEHFDSISIKLAYVRQRLLACIAEEVLNELGLNTVRSGDDLFFNGIKLSISIASASPVSHKIHFGINVRCEEYMSLEKMGIIDPEPIMAEIGKRYAAEQDDIEHDMRKSRPLEAFTFEGTS